MEVIKMNKARWNLPFCRDTTGRTMELRCFYNDTQAPVTIVNTGTTRRFGVAAGGKWYGVLYGGAFVATHRTIWIDDDGLAIWDGKVTHIINEEGHGWRYGDDETVYHGPITLREDGTVKIGIYRWPISPAGNPMVHVEGMAGVDSQGQLLVRETSRISDLKQYRYIQAQDGGELCITSDRAVFCRNWYCPEFAGEIVDIQMPSFGYVLLSRCGFVYFSADGRQWRMIEKDACAIAGDEYLATADLTGTIRVYEFDNKKDILFCKQEFKRPGREISEVFITNKVLVWKYVDTSFEIETL